MKETTTLDWRDVRVPDQRTTPMMIDTNGPLAAQITNIETIQDPGPAQHGCLSTERPSSQPRLLLLPQRPEDPRLPPVHPRPKGDLTAGTLELL